MRCKGQRGGSTAEVAVLLPAVAAMLVLALGVGSAGATQVRLEQAARAAARELARGESAATAIQTGQRLAGEGATVIIGGDGGFRRVHVSADTWIPTLDGGEGLLVLKAEAEARAESGEPPGGGDHGGP